MWISIRRIKKKNWEQIFFKHIILEVVEKLEVNNANLEFNFNISNINDELLRRSKTEKSNVHIITDKIQKEKEKFKEKYIYYKH